LRQHHPTASRRHPLGSKPFSALVRRLRTPAQKPVVGHHLRPAIFLDAFGLLLSLGNRCILRRALPTARQIQFWDRFVIPCSRAIDPLIAHKLGKTIVAVWENPADGG